MKKARTLLVRLARNEDGVTIVEFAFVAPIFLVILLGIFDFGFQIYGQAVLTGSMQTAARKSTLEPGGLTSEEIDELVQNSMNFVSPWSEMEFTRSNYRDYDDVRQAESFSDENGDGECNDGEPFEDVNGNRTFDTDRGVAGLGGADDVVLYEARAKYDRVFPFWKFIGVEQEVELYSATVLRNQPYANQGERIPEVGNCE